MSTNKPETLFLRHKFFFNIAADTAEHMTDIYPSEPLLERLRKMKADVFTFLERKWCCPISNPSKSWAVMNDNIALLHLVSYKEWWSKIGKKTRNMIRKAEKSGIKTQIAEPNEKLAGGMWRIYNETPIRQQRAFPHFGITLQTVKKGLSLTQDFTYIGAYLQNDLVGFVQLIYGRKIAVVSQILSLQKHWDKAVNNALMAKTVEVCASRNEEWVMYGRMGNHPSLDNFKQNNGFKRFELNRYYVPITSRGTLAIRLGLHKEVKDSLPTALRYPLFPIYSWASRTKMRIKLALGVKTDASLSGDFSEG